MKISQEEQQIIERILAHHDAGTTDMMPQIMRNPVENYTSTDKLNQEINTLFRQFPLVLGHASDLANPGDFFTNNETGVPLLVTRTRDGQVMAFQNVCRHRGAQVEGRPCGNASVFSCPYHSWTYGLDGSFRGMPGKEGFKDLDKADLGLVQVPAWERFGLIFVRPAPSDEVVDIDHWLAPMAAQLDGLDIGSHTLFKRWEVPLDMSWKIAIEGFQESYHFCHAHKHTACEAYLDNQAVFLSQYPHVRHAVPLPRVLDLKDQPAESWEYRPNFLTQNYLFPANFVQVQVDHVYLHTVIPTGPGTCVFKCMMLIPEAPQTEKAERYWNKNYDLIRIVFEEDFTIGRGIQRGLASGANTDFTFGTNECALHHGQQAINDALAGTLKVPTKA